MNASSAKHRKSILLVSIALLALFGGVTASWITNRISAPEPPQLQVATALLEQAKPLPEFTLVDGAGNTFSKADLEGRWSFLFFGYTHCPDICPTTLSTLNEALRAIDRAGKAKSPQVVFVSVDPRRDPPEKLKEYVSYFNPEFVGVTGKPASLDGLTRALGIVHVNLASEGDGENYVVDHSASVLLIDPAGKLAALFSAPHRAELIAGDFQKLRAYDEQG